MKPRVSNQKTAALTLVEVLVVIVVLFVLAALFLPVSSHPHVARESQCVQNLKIVGLAYHVWAGDHNGKYPMQVSVTNGGTMELTDDGENPWLNFLAMSNELNSPKWLYCPADNDRICIENFTNGLFAKNISYFVGLDADTNHPQMFLSGDDNFQLNRAPLSSGVLKLFSDAPIAWTDWSGGRPNYGLEQKLPTNATIAWSDERHYGCGNIDLADGSVHQVSNSNLTNLLRQSGIATNRLAIP
jgi:competence protein ComGC